VVLHKVPHRMRLFWPDPDPALATRTGIEHGLLYQRLLHNIAACRLSRRAPRTNAPVVTGKMSNFKLKRGSPPPASQHPVAF
jgi:hypothetical protein